jgi:hypothetical protein
MRAATVKMWALHLVANAVVVAGFYWWLGIGDASALQLGATVLFGALLAAFTVWLQGTVFAHFREPESPASHTYRTALRNLLPLLAVAVVAVALYWLLKWLLGWAESPAFNIASWLTLHLRKPVRPALILSIITWKVRVVEWVVIPVVLLPLAAGVAGDGWSGFARASFARLRSWIFWIGCPLLLLLAIYVPCWLIHKVPYQGSLALEMTSFIVRWLVAWLLFVTAWFAVVALACGHRLWGLKERRDGEGEIG